MAQKHLWRIATPAPLRKTKAEIKFQLANDKRAAKQAAKQEERQRIAEKTVAKGIHIVCPLASNRQVIYTKTFLSSPSSRAGLKLSWSMNTGIPNIPQMSVTMCNMCANGPMAQSFMLPHVYSCRTVWNRDAMAAANSLAAFKHMANNNNKRPTAFARSTPTNANE